MTTYGGCAASTAAIVSGSARRSLLPAVAPRSSRYVRSATYGSSSTPVNTEKRTTFFPISVCGVRWTMWVAAVTLPAAISSRTRSFSARSASVWAQRGSSPPTHADRDHDREREYGREEEDRKALRAVFEDGERARPPHEHDQQEERDPPREPARTGAVGRGSLET